MNEQIARLEAKLRGWEKQEDNWLWCDGQCGLHPDEPVRASHPATDPATPEGREWWCEALKLTVRYYRGLDVWVVESTPASGIGWLLIDRPSRTEAIIAAIEAAALAAVTHPERASGKE